MTISLDGTEVGELLAQDTGDSDQGWNAFVLGGPVQIGELAGGEHTLAVAVSGGDGYGVEIDAIALSYCTSVLCRFLPMVTKAP
ncbi:MAG: hypothetical protein GWN58_37395 [Anaerolineae bacterium]|nr:hypothetical protein [Anaerolineae bacterium]